MRKSLALGLATVSLTGVGALVPAAANATTCTVSATSCSSTTTLTVSLTGGSLSLAAPDTASMSGSANTASVVTGTVAGNAVTDNRGTLLGWQVQASATNPTNSTTSHSISLGTTGPLGVVGNNLTAGAGGLLGTGLKPALGVAGFLSATPTTVLSAPATVGGGTYNYDLSLTLTVPANTYADTYTSTITQTVS